MIARRTDDAPLQRMLRSFRRYSPLYGERLSNHLPMATIALWRMGADDAQIDRFAKRYARRLQPRPELTQAAQADAAHVPPHLGAGEFARDAAFFAAQLDASGAPAVLAQWIARLLPGVASSAFHDLIRTAYAVESGCVEELADALASWSAEYVDFAMPWWADERSPQALIDEVVARFDDRRDYQGPIVDRMLAVSRDPFFARGVPLPPALSLERIRQAVLQLYASGDDFTVLHTVTATHAMRTLQRFMPDRDAACRYLWRGVLLAVATVADAVARNRASPASVATDAPWETIVQRGRDSLDDHVVKLVYTAWQESALGEDDSYRQVAARKAGVSA
ncbi:questin oxidase family protein [Lysobacter sp. CA199]|uniref:questin oxidase family protein n=1 Tax=Lysobacter sp. CA199 TaxID=3455608 RepID=UPI003F8CFEA0